MIMAIEPAHQLVLTLKPLAAYDVSEGVCQLAGYHQIRVHWSAFPNLPLRRQSIY